MRPKHSLSFTSLWAVKKSSGLPVSRTLMEQPPMCVSGASSLPDKSLIDKVLSLQLLFPAVCFYSLG